VRLTESEGYAAAGGAAATTPATDRTTATTATRVDHRRRGLLRRPCEGDDPGDAPLLRGSDTLAHDTTADPLPGGTPGDSPYLPIRPDFPGPIIRAAPGRTYNSVDTGRGGQHLRH
jgi:hypothetical protein